MSETGMIDVTTAMCELLLARAALGNKLRSVAALDEAGLNAGNYKSFFDYIEEIDTSLHRTLCNITEEITATEIGLDNTMPPDMTGAEKAKAILEAIRRRNEERSKAAEPEYPDNPFFSFPKK